MPLSSKYPAYIIIIGLMLMMINSCIKQQPDCSGNCYALSIKGSVYDKTNNSALANMPVNVYWIRKSSCTGCSDKTYDIVKGKSANDGTFNLNTTIDTTFFRDYYMYIKVPTDSSHLCVGGRGGSDRIEMWFDQFNPEALQHLQFEFYPKTLLTISLHRTQNDRFDYFTVEHAFTNQFDYMDYIISGQQFAVDTIFTVATSADIYTKIHWQKVVGLGQTIEKEDSLICTKNGTNSFAIDF